MTLQHPLLGRVTVAKNHKGYWRISAPARLRGKYLHRAVFETVAGRPVKAGFHVHHANGRGCCCPEYLVEIQPALHPAVPLQCPYTGRYLTPREYSTMVG